MAFQYIQLSNTTGIGAVAAGDLVPLGAVTRSFMCSGAAQPTFVVGTTGSNTITITDCGVYEVEFNASVVAGAAGVVTLNLTQNGAVVATASQTATAADDTENLSITYLIRVFPNIGGFSNAPSTIQVLNTGVALTGGTSNIIVRRIK